MNEDILYTPEEIAQKLKITKGTVYEMIKRGDLEAHRIGRHIRISDTQFQNYLFRCKGYENIYEADITRENGETSANLGPISMHVSTELEGRVKISINPEHIILSKGTFISSARNMFKGTVTKLIDEVNAVTVVVDIGVPIKALITAKSLNEMDIEKGTELYAVFKTMSVKVYK